MTKRIIILGVLALAFAMLQIMLTNIRLFLYIDIYMIIISLIFLRSLWRNDVYLVILLASSIHALLQGYNIAAYSLPTFITLLILVIWRNMFSTSQVVLDLLGLVLSLAVYSLLSAWILGIALPGSLTEINLSPIIIKVIVGVIIGGALAKLLFFVRSEYELKI